MFILGLLIGGTVGFVSAALVRADEKHAPANEERCVCCGAVVPEGRQVCPQCERGWSDGNREGVH